MENQEVHQEEVWFGYLLNITEITELSMGLSLKDFIMKVVCKDNKELPDIDTDFPKFKRDEVIKYIENKYGKDKVSHIETY